MLILKVAEDDPAGMVTDAGTVATEVVPDANVTKIPPAGAAAPNATVPTEMLPAETVEGLSVNVVSVGLTTPPICNRHIPRP